MQAQGSDPVGSGVVDPTGKGQAMKENKLAVIGRFVSYHDGLLLSPLTRPAKESEPGEECLL